MPISKTFTLEFIPIDSQFQPHPTNVDNMGSSS